MSDDPSAVGPWIDPMREADLDEVMAIEELSFSAPWTRAMFQEELVREWANLWVVREAVGGPVVASICFWLVRDEVHVLNVAVHPKHRRRGYAKVLIARAIELAVEKSVRYVTLEVRRSNVGAIELYKSFAFKSIGIRPRYYSDNNEDAIVMLLTLAGGPASKSRE